MPYRTALPLTLAALAALGLSGCDRLWPFANDTGATNVSKPGLASAPIPATPALQPPAQAALPAPPARMTASQEAELDGWIMKTYLGCWQQPPAPAGSDPYVARVRLAFKPDGSLAKAPKLVNPPSDPALKPTAKSVLQAVHACNPLPVPAQYRPFYEQWRSKTVQFNPQVAGR